MWPELVEIARWAPSPHNIQPWLVRPLDDARAELLYDPARLLPDTDPTGRFTTVGFGIFVETLAVAARAHGHDVVADGGVPILNAAAREPRRFFPLRLVTFTGDEPLDPRLVLERRTSRVPYDGRAVAPATLDELRRVAASYGHDFEFSSDAALVDFVLGLNRDTLFHDLTDPVARREVGQWLRFSADEAERRADGFSPDALGYPGWLLRAFFHARGVFELPGLRQLTRGLYFRTMRGTRTIGWLAGEFEEPEHWFRAGRMLARLWLTMTRDGVVLHPFGSIITNVDANARLQDRIRVPRGTLWLVVRMGYSAEPPRSHRLAAREVLVG